MINQSVSHDIELASFQESHSDYTLYTLRECQLDQLFRENNFETEISFLEDPDDGQWIQFYIAILTKDGYEPVDKNTVVSESGLQAIRAFLSMPLVNRKLGNQQNIKLMQAGIMRS